MMATVHARPAGPCPSLGDSGTSCGVDAWGAAGWGIRGTAVAEGNDPTSGNVARLRSWLSAHVHRDVLRLEVFLDALGPTLAAESGLFDAAERRAGVGDEPLVQADHAGLQRFHDGERA